MLQRAVHLIAVAVRVPMELQKCVFQRLLENSHVPVLLSREHSPLILQMSYGNGVLFWFMRVCLVVHGAVLPAKFSLGLLNLRRVSLWLHAQSCSSF